MPSLRTFSLACAYTAMAATASTADPLHGRGNDVAQHSVYRSLPPTINTIYSAVVGAKGQLIRGSGVVSSDKVALGSYTVGFANDVSACTYVATVGETGAKSSEPAVFVTVAAANGVANNVYVQTFDVTGAIANYPFHLDVAC
jgi:hypothetical protein